MEQGKWRSARLPGNLHNQERATREKMESNAKTWNVTQGLDWLAKKRTWRGKTMQNPYNKLGDVWSRTTLIPNHVPYYQIHFLSVVSKTLWAFTATVVLAVSWIMWDCSVSFCINPQCSWACLHLALSELDLPRRQICWGIWGVQVSDCQPLKRPASEKSESRWQSLPRRTQIATDAIGQTGAAPYFFHHLGPGRTTCAINGNSFVAEQRHGHGIDVTSLTAERVVPSLSSVRRQACRKLAPTFWQKNEDNRSWN